MRKVILVAAALAVVASVAAADTQPLPAFSAYTQRVEHLGLVLDTTRCVRVDWTTTKDAGAVLAGASDATWAAGADAAVYPVNLPSPDLNYICVSQNAVACMRQRVAPDSCKLTAVLPQDLPAMPLMFMREADGGLPVVYGVSGTSGATASVECCPVVPVTYRGR